MNTDALLIAILIAVVILVAIVFVLIVIVLKLVNSRRSEQAILKTYLQLQSTNQNKASFISNTPSVSVTMRKGDLESDAKSDAKIEPTKLSPRAELQKLVAENHHRPRSFKSLSSETVGEFANSNANYASNHEVNAEYEKAMRLMLDKQSVFVTGAAGTGKSTLLRNFLSKTSGQTVVVAPTGMAAINISGQTIHSFFRLPFHPLNKGDAKRVRNDQLYKAIDTIVIDEVSMVRSDVMDGIDEFMRLNGRDPNKPFGGVQLITFGDLYQLPPIVKGKEQSKFFSEVYKSQFFFDAHVFDEMSLTTVELKRVYRQTNPEFIETLNAMRIGRMSPDQLDQVNGRHDPKFVHTDASECVSLTPTRALANDINIQRLESLADEVVFYEADADGEMAQQNSDEHNTDNFEDKLPADAVLRLKRNAQVMLLKNDPQKRWVNGTIGRIKSLETDCINVDIRDGSHVYTYPITREKWSKLKYKYDPDKRRIESQEVGSFVQFPLALAWAMTIHKSQGQTYNEVIVDLGEGGAFAEGQTYVALSRCRSLNGLRLRVRISPGDIKVNPYIARFEERLMRAVNIRH